VFPTHKRFLDAVRNPPGVAIRVEVWRGGGRVDPFGDDGIPVHGGAVDVDSTKQVRRSLSGVEVDDSDEMWDLLSPVGTELRVFRGFRYLNGETDMVPVGQFVIPNLSESYGGSWVARVGSSPDKMVLVQRARFTLPRLIPAGYLIRQAISDLMEEVLGPVTNLATSYARTTSPMLLERDRGKAVADMCKSIGADAFMSPDGIPMVVDRPQLAETPVWNVNAGDDGILYSASRERSYERTYSGVVAAPAQIDGSTPFTPAVVWDEDPKSPTWRFGPYGEVPYFLTSPFFENYEQAYRAALSLLPQVTAPRAQLTLEAECNPALADGDTISVSLPPRRRGDRTVVERHLVGPFTVPLTVDGTQRIDTVSAVADVEDSE
jgi:hypothetical protein